MLLLNWGGKIVNTDQAFDFLREAGVSEDICIQTVRRWLRDRKINYEGDGLRKRGYILENTDEAFDMLKDAGVTEGIGVHLVRRWLREGKIQNVGEGHWGTSSQPKETTSNNHTEQDKMIRQLQLKLKAQDEHIKGMEKIHQTSINTLVQQRNKLKTEISSLLHEKSELQMETKKLLKENIDLHHEVLKLKEELSKDRKKDPEKDETFFSTPSNHYYHKLGLSKNVGKKEILAGYKRLLKMTHPDHGGSAAAFHYIKTDYDHFRSTIK
jgi:regulator of replication initiation timing